MGSIQTDSLRKTNRQWTKKMPWIAVRGVAAAAAAKAAAAKGYPILLAQGTGTSLPNCRY